MASGLRHVCIRKIHACAPSHRLSHCANTPYFLIGQGGGRAGGRASTTVVSNQRLMAALAMGWELRRGGG